MRCYHGDSLRDVIGCISCGFANSQSYLSLPFLAFTAHHSSIKDGVQDCMHAVVIVSDGEKAGD